MKMISKVLISALIVSAAVFAGNEAGNGGHVLVCKNGEQQNVQFFDLWYATKELQETLIDSAKEAREIGADIVLKLYKANKDLFEDLLVSYADVTNAKVRISD